MTPTPLPDPLSAHDADPTRTSQIPLTRDQRPTLPLRGGEAASSTSPQPRDVELEDDAPTCIAPDAGWRPPATARRRSRRPPPEPPPLPPPAPTPVPERAEIFDEATRLGDSLAEAGLAAIPPERLRARGGSAPGEPLVIVDGAASGTAIDDGNEREGDEDEEETNPGLSPDDLRRTDPVLRPQLPAVSDAGEEDEAPAPRVTALLRGGRAGRGAADDPGARTERRLPAIRGPEPGGIGADWEEEQEEVTDVAAADGSRAATRDSGDHTEPEMALPILTGQPREDSRRHRVAVTSHRHGAFLDDFVETLRGLAPDGTAIDAPLSFFSQLPEEALQALIQKMSVRSFRAGDVILHEGDPGDACYVIAQGSVRVLKRNPADAGADAVEVGRLTTGSVFGEFAVLADRRRHATVQAVDDCDLYEISRGTLRRLADSYPEVAPALERYYRERLLSTLIVTAPFFRPLAEERRCDLLARFHPERHEGGESVVDEGRPAGGFYLIVLGSVEITKKLANGRNVRLATLGEGSYFGELSLMRGGVARATVSTTGPTELAVLRPDDFYEVVAKNPILWEAMRAEAHRRELMLNQIVTGDTDVI